MEKKKRPMKKVQTGAASHEGVDAATPEEITLADRDAKTRRTAVRKFLVEYWLWFKKHKYDVLSGLLVAFAAVSLASLLTQWIEQRALDKATRQMLNLVLVETEHNAIIVEYILNEYEKAEVAHITIGRLDSTATVAAFLDVNLLPFLSFQRVAELRTYINTITLLNQSLQTYYGILENEGYRETSKVEKWRQIVYDNAVGAFATNAVVKENLKEYFDESYSDKENTKNTPDRLKFYKEKARKGEFSGPYE